MLYYSTKNVKHKASLKDAVLKGLASDKGLYMPSEIPSLPNSFFQNIKNYKFKDIALEVAKAFFQDELSYADLKSIVYDAINFEAPVVELGSRMKVLELWHGPTCAFKDVGARFMARLLGHFSKNSDKEINVLVATSGDTGSAVANGFLNVPNIKVTILYPSGGVSKIQEQQLTTLGSNITALEIKGTFDDCQRLVKTAFVDDDINSEITLTSANSINIARLIPQTFYYFYAYAQVVAQERPVVFSVPSGNYGNLTAGLFAQRMGLPVKKFVVSTNANSIVPEYLETGEYLPRPSVATISNAMDVGDPSNFARMADLYGNSVAEMRKDMVAYHFSDEETRSAMKEIKSEYDYVMDPHGAVAYLGLQKQMAKEKNALGILLETAHPAKFLDVVKDTLDVEVKLPERLAECMEKKKESIVLSKDFEDLKAFLLAK